MVSQFLVVQPQDAHRAPATFLAASQALVTAPDREAHLPGATIDAGGSPACETTDTFIADLAVAAGVGQLKTGATAHGERVAKYNRLLEIEGTSGRGLPYGLAY